MKNSLQGNNYSTPEQSERIIKLGIPEWSADCFRDKITGELKVRQSLYTKRKDFFRNHKDYIEPVWSLGRLVQIDMDCANWEHPDDIDWGAVQLARRANLCLVESMIIFWESIVKEGKADFTKIVP